MYLLLVEQGKKNQCLLVGLSQDTSRLGLVVLIGFPLSRILAFFYPFINYSVFSSPNRFENFRNLHMFGIVEISDSAQ